MYMDAFMEFGVKWGQNLALFQSFRGMYEPYNHNRKIIGFDTFEGFPSVDKKDGGSKIIKAGALVLLQVMKNIWIRFLPIMSQKVQFPILKNMNWLKVMHQKQLCSI